MTRLRRSSHPAQFPGRCAGAPRTCDAQALQAAEVRHAEPRPRRLGARLVETHAQVGGQPRRGNPGGSGAERRGGAGRNGRRGGGGRAAGGPGQDGLDGEGRLEAPRTAGCAWAGRAALGRRGIARERGLVPSSGGSGRPAASRHRAGHGAAPAGTGRGSGARAWGQPCGECERRGAAPHDEGDSSVSKGPSAGRGLLNLAGRGGAGGRPFPPAAQAGPPASCRADPPGTARAKSRWALPPSLRV